jgi:hypothetical protein
MKTLRLLNSFFLSCLRSIVQDFLAFFRFSEADACALLSAYGLHALEVDRLQNNRPNEHKETSGNSEKIIYCKRLGHPPRPIPIGVHPDVIWGNWMTASRRHGDRRAISILILDRSVPNGRRVVESSMQNRNR